MEKLTNKLKNSLTFKNRKVRLSFVVFLVLVLSQVTLPINIFASAPQFNFLPGDHQLLRGANATLGETTWHDPVAASPNDVVAIIAYFHNGVEGTTATNTKIRVELPQQASINLVSQGYLWADNAAQVTDNFVVNASQVALMEYIPGTTQLYLGGSQTPQPLPDGITGPEGVNIGNIVGCWEFAGYVVFQTKLTAPGVADLTIDKKVANSTTDPGTQNWYEQNTANPGDVLAYRLYFINPGTATAENTIMSDVLPAHVQYLAGTTKLYTNLTGPSGQLLPDTITASGVSLGNIEPGAGNSGYVVFQVKVDPSLGTGNYTLINTGKISADNISQKQDTASTLINIAGQVDLTISKLVRNVTQDQAEFVEENTASAGDVLEYKLYFTVSGTVDAINVKTSDVLPNVSGVPMHYISGSAKLYFSGAETNLPDTIVTGGVVLGNFSPGDSGYVTFRVRIDNCPAVGQFTLVNTGKISADNVSQKQDTATTHLTVTPPPEPYLNLEKLVKNETQGESNWIDSNIAVPGDTLEYYVWFKNVGDGQATQVLIKDVLPPKVTYIPGTTVLHMGGGTQALPDGIVGDGVGIPDLIPGQEGYITFKVTVATDAIDKSVLIDTAHIYSDGGYHAQDTASTTVSIQPVTPPGKVLATKMPPTGGMATLALVLASIILGIYYYIKVQREFLKEFAKSRLL